MATIRALEGSMVGGGPATFASTQRAVFPSPFLDITDLSLPRDIKDILRVCESVYFYNPIVKAGIDRLVSYPITRFRYDTPSEDLQKRYKYLHEEVLDLKSFYIEAGKDVWVYGNCFISPYFPFDRSLLCPACKIERPISQVNYKFTRYAFHATCKCGYQGVFTRIDRRSMDMSRMRVIRWNPHNIFILHNEISGHTAYWYQLDGEMRSKIIAGDPEILETTPWEFVVAVQKGLKFKFKEGMLFHIKQATLSGRYKSWGLPPVLPLIKLHYFTAALRRANIAIAYDMSVPFRVMYPERGGAVGDPASQLNLVRWKGEMEKMLRNHRLDPTSVKLSPNPVGYQAVGSEARALLYSQEIRLANEEIMAALHIPQDLFYGTLTAQAAPVSLRLLQNSMSYYLQGLDRLCTWLNRHISSYFDLEYAGMHLTNFMDSDDMMRQQAVTSLVSMGKLSDTTLLETYGMDALNEYRKLLREQAAKQRIDAEINKEMANTEQGPGPTPADMATQALDIAQQWLAMPYEQRRSHMNEVQKADQNLYAQALQNLEVLRKQSRVMGAPPGAEVPNAGL